MHAGSHTHTHNIGDPCRNCYSRFDRCIHLATVREPERLLYQMAAIVQGVKAVTAVSTDSYLATAREPERLLYHIYTAYWDSSHTKWLRLCRSVKVGLKG